MNARKITDPQRKAIFVYARNLGLDDATLHELVHQITGRTSIADLTLDQASAVISHLLDISSGHKPQASSLKFSDMDGRPGMATGAQLRKIEAMWANVSTAKDKSAALRRWLSNKFQVSGLRFLTRGRASDVIVALEKF